MASKTRKSLFKEAGHKKYADIVSFKDVYEAQESMKKLKQEFNQATRFDKKLRIARVAQYSANRVKAILNKKNLSTQEKSEFKKIWIVYDTLAEQLFSLYDKQKEQREKKGQKILKKVNNRIKKGKNIGWGW